MTEGKVDCTVLLYVVKDGEGYRSAVRFFLYGRPSPLAERLNVMGEAEGRVLLGWSVPLGGRTFQTVEELKEAYASEPKGVPQVVWSESTEEFLARKPMEESIPAGVLLDREFAKAHNLCTYITDSETGTQREAPVV